MLLHVFQNDHLTSTKTKERRNHPWILFEIGQIILAIPIKKAVFCLCFSRQSAGSLEQKLRAEALWHGSVLQLWHIRHLSKVRAFMSCASIALADTVGPGAKLWAEIHPQTWAFGPLRLLPNQPEESTVPQSGAGSGGRSLAVMCHGGRQRKSSKKNVNIE